MSARTVMSSRNLIRLVALACCAFVLWSAAFGQLPNLQHRAIILACCVSLGVLIYPHGIERLRWAGRALDIAMFGVTVAGAAYIVVNYWDFMLDPGSPTGWALGLGIAVILVVLELARRSIGWTFAILVSVFAAYALLGHLIPGQMGHGGASWHVLVDMLFLSTDGLWGPIMDIYVSLLILFVIFSSLMMATGAGDVFMDLAKIVGGRMWGGPAKIAVISSAFVGSMTGSSVTNVAMTGNFTIPLMKRMGYRPEVAGGIEATASSGGQITPPLMGAGLFLMADLLEIDVGQMMLVALVPSFLFYVGVISAVHFEARRHGIAALPPEEIPPWSRLKAFGTWAPLAVPFAVLVVMLIRGFSVDLALLAAILSLVGTYLSAARSWRELACRGRTLFDAMAETAKPLVSLGILCAAAGILVGVIGFVGIGVKFSDLVLSLGGGNLPATLALAAVVVLIIGMGIPTTAAYVLAASVISVAFQRLGVAELPTHMFIFYFATLSAITPPVCAAVYVAAGLADAPWFKVALHTVRFAVIKYFLPFLFIFHPQLLLQGSAGEIVLAIVTCAVGAVFLAASLAGHLLVPQTLWRRVLMAGGAVLVLWPEPLTIVAGAVPLAALLLLDLYQNRARKGVPAQ